MFVCKNCGCEFKKFESSEKKCPVCEIPFYNRVYYCINVSVDANELKVKMIRLKAEKEMLINKKSEEVDGIWICGI